jgi:hypothetical protein
MEISNISNMRRAEDCGSVAYAYVPFQILETVYDTERALDRGTLFPELDLPLGVYGKRKSKGGGMCG